MARRPGPSRPDRVAALIKEVLSQTLLVQSRDPVLRRAVITDVRVSGDVSVAKVYWLALDDQTPRDELEAALKRAQGFLRTQVGQAVRTRLTPELRFLYDESVIRGRRIDELLREVAPAAEAAPDSATGAAPPHSAEDEE